MHDKLADVRRTIDRALAKRAEWMREQAVMRACHNSSANLIRALPLAPGGDGEG